jgi:hypothetical protein
MQPPRAWHQGLEVPVPDHPTAPPRNPLWVLDVVIPPAPFARCDLPRTATVDQLVEHCAGMGDRALRHDFAECVFGEGRTEADREQLAAYYRARTGHPTFKPGSWTANNHRAVIAAWRAGVDGQKAAAARAAATARRCKHCGRDLRKGSRAATCGDRCRKALSRARKV